MENLLLVSLLALGITAIVIHLRRKKAEEMERRRQELLKYNSPEQTDLISIQCKSSDPGF